MTNTTTWEVDMPAETTRRSGAPSALPGNEKAMASTPVPMGPESHLFRRASGDGEVRVPAKDWNFVAQLARVGAIGLAHRTREDRLTAAVSDGRIARVDLSRWRASYNRDPQGTHAALEQLRPNATRATANATRPRRAAASGPAPAPRASSAQVTRGEDGSLFWKGQPAQLNAAGKPAVFTQQGWMDIDAAAAAGVTAEDLRSAVPLMQGTPDWESYRRGPNGGAS